MGIQDSEPAVPERGDANGRGFFDYLPDLYFAPREAFAGILRKPSFWAPLLILIALSLVFTAVWIQNVDFGEFMRVQLEESGQAEKLTAEQKEQMVETQVRVLPAMTWGGAVLGSPVVVTLVAAAMLLVFRLFFGAGVSFRESMSVTAHSFMTVGLLQTPLMLLTLWLKGDWNLNPQEVLSANPTLLLDKSEAAGWLWSLAGSMDLLSFWTIFLLASGFGVASKRSTSSAVAGVLAVWAVYVAIKVGAALMG